MEVKMIDAVNSMGNLLSWMDPASINKLQRNPFAKTDQNDDGVIDQTELQTFADHLSKKMGKTIDEKALFAQLDTNKSGAIDKEEFKAGRETVREMIGPMKKPPKMKGMGFRNEESSENDTDAADLYDALQTASLTGYTNSLSTLLGENEGAISLFA